MSHPLIRPLRLGALEIPNRIVLAPLTRVRASATHVPGTLMAEHYRQRASGGLLIAEATMISPDAQAWMHQPGIFSNEQIAGWRQVTDAVHAAGGRIQLQLWHPGRATHPDLNQGVQPVSSSAKAIPDDTVHTPSGKKAYPVPRALAEEEIPAYVAAFAKAAQHAKEAGFDGVQVHGAHGYLIDQFLRDSVNDRTDRYGGSLTARARFLFEVVDAVVAVWGGDRVGLRISPNVSFNGMSDSAPRALVEHVASECGRRSLAYLELRHPLHDAPGEEALFQAARSQFSGAILRNGGYTPETAADAVESGRADAIAFGTLFLANPDLPRRILEGKPLNEPDPSTFYSQGERGYTDYPSLPC
jgi:N-ethylmaleimide reductase